MFRLFLVAATFAAVFAAGHLLHLNSTFKKPSPDAKRAEMANASGFVIPAHESALPPPGADVTADVIRSHFESVASLREPAKTKTGAPSTVEPPQAYVVPNGPGEDPVFIPNRVLHDGLVPQVVSNEPRPTVQLNTTLPQPPAEQRQFQTVFSRSDLISFPFEIGQMGPSGVREAQLWMTRDSGRTWQLLVKQLEAKSPIEARLPGEGQFGFRLVLIGGDGATSGPPQPGWEPELLVSFEMRDRTPPRGRLLPAVAIAEDGPAPREALYHTGPTAEPFELPVHFSTARPAELGPMPRERQAP